MDGGIERRFSIGEGVHEIETTLTSNQSKIVVLGLVVAVIALLYSQFSDQLTLSNLATQESALRDYQSDHPILVYGIALLVYVAATGLSLPGAVVLTLAYGWYFGLVPAFVLVSLSSAAGATVAFLLSRYLFRDAIQNRFGDRLLDFNDRLQREGAFYLFTLRLIPAVPFFVINVVMGLTPMKVWTFWWVSQLGMLAGTLVYVYVGSTVPDLNTLAERGTSGILTPQLLVAFSLLGVFPLVVKRIMHSVRGSRVV